MSTQFHRESINTGSQQFDIVVGSYGDAKGTKEQFEQTDPSCLDGTISELGNTKSFADHIASRIEDFRQRLSTAWQGDTAKDALDILSALSSDATTISSSAAQCASALSHFQQQWVSARNQAMNLYEGVLGTGFHEDNSGAHTIFRQFCQSMSDGMHEMPGTLSYHTGMGPHEVYGGQPPAGGGGAGGGGLPGMGGGGGIPGGGQYASPGSPGSLNPGSYPHQPGVPGSYGDPGAGAGGPGSGIGGPGGGGPGDPGGFGGGSPAPTWPPAAGGASYGDGTTTLSGYGGYPGGVGAAGGGTSGGFAGGGLGAGGLPGGGGLGAAAGLPAAGLTGAAGGGVAPVAAVAAVAPGEGGAGGTRAGMMPMRGATGDDDERDRSTWLDEDGDVWGAAEGLPPVLS